MKHGLFLRGLAAATAAVLLTTAAPDAAPAPASAAVTDISNTMKWDTLRIGGGGFVSGIVTGKKAMYARTDVGGAYRYNYQTDTWEQLFGFISDADRGLLSVDAMAIDPNDDNTVYFLCGCAYFSNARTVIFKTTDGGKTFTETDVSDMIQVHGNGYGRQMGESIAVDPDDPNTIYAGGDVCKGASCLIKSTDGGKTWNTVESYGALGLFSESIKWPTWTEDMRNAVNDLEYVNQNGVSCIYIYGGKVYVGTSVTGKNNVVVASTKDDKFTDMSSKLDAANYPARISGDGKGNLFFAFQGAVCVGNGASSGGIYKLNTKSGEITDISPLKHLYSNQKEAFENPAEAGYSGISVDPANPEHMVSSTCGLFANAQLWQPWDEEHGPCWGDKFFKTEDGGEHWIEITPGIAPVWGQPPIADYLADGGYDWIRDKAIHWVGAYVIDPAKPDRSISTSGNGLFACDDTWADVPQFHFHPDGVEEVVCLDFVSVPGGNAYSAIGDYDGFIHTLDPTAIPQQYQPNMGSTCAIAYCPQDPKVMLRIAEGDGNNTATGYYTLDGGATWTGMKCSSGGKAAVVQLAKGKYRFLKSGKESGAVSYSDDFGSTWKDASGISGYKPSYFLVDPNDPLLVYASGITYNQYWASNPNVTEPSFDECHYSMYVSHDGGATWEENPVCRYDMCDAAGDPAYIKEDTIAMAAGWYGLYIVTKQGAEAEKTDVFYCKTVGYGAPEKEGGVNTLFIYGKPNESDPEGIYRSTDAGKTWVCINTKNLYGGTGNGNFLVGDMNVFGRVYMSTVGCGIVYGTPSGGTVNPPVTTAPEQSKVNWGDADCSGEVDLLDAVLLCKAAASVGNVKLSAQGRQNSDVTGDGKLDSDDTVKLLKYLAGNITGAELAP